MGLVPTVLRGGQACGTLAVYSRPSLASWNFPWAIWRPCQRPAITWGRWAAFAPRVTASVGLPILLMIMLASAHPSTAMTLVPPMGAAGLVAASQRTLSRVKQPVKQVRVAVYMAVGRAMGTVLVVMPAVACQARVLSRVVLRLAVMPVLMPLLLLPSWARPPGEGRPRPCVK